jgi:hypothetical protein
MPRFLIDLPMPFDPTDRLEGFLQKAAVSPFHNDPVVRAAVSRVQGYLRDRLTTYVASEGGGCGDRGAGRTAAESSGLGLMPAGSVSETRVQE